MKYYIVAVLTILNVAFGLFTFCYFDRENYRRAKETIRTDELVDQVLIHPMAIPPEIVMYLKSSAESEARYKAERTRIITMFGIPAEKMYVIIRK
jgi:hypothetical protein